MFSQLIRQTVQFLTGGPYRLSLQRYASQVILGFHKGRRPVPLHRVIRKFPPVAELEKLLAPQIDQDTFVVLLTNLSAVKALLATFTTLDLLIEIAPDVAALEPSPIPEQFEVRYFWNVDEECIQQQGWRDTNYFGKGWFANQSNYWHVNNTSDEDTSDEDDRWLNRQKITGSDIIHFLTRITPDWKKKHLPYRCHLKYNVTPVVAFKIVSEGINKLELQIKWYVESRFIRPIVSLEQYVLIFDEIRPGISPKMLPFTASYTSGNFSVLNEEIPHFVENTWPLIQQFTYGAKDSFLKQHTVIQGPASLKLIAQPRKERGIGKPVIVPTLTCGSFTMPGQEASALLSKRQAYYRVTNGWLPAALIQQAGIEPHNQTRSGFSLNPETLMPGEIIRQRSLSTKLSVVFPPINLPQGDKPADAAAQHIQFLRTWGISGGIIGTAAQYTTTLKLLVASLLSDYPPVRILVLGSAESLTQRSLKSCEANQI